jgi:4-diphosphocytidyl-2C-methyl-D-erythritol kinase
LEPGALARCPRIGGILRLLRGEGAACALVTGTGPTAFGLFGSREAALRAVGRASRAGHWATATCGAAQTAL